jgi:hypothetical protein
VFLGGFVEINTMRLKRSLMGFEVMILMIHEARKRGFRRKYNRAKKM